MAGRDSYIELQTGEAAWTGLARLIIAGLALSSLLFAPTDLLFKLIAIAALAFMTVLVWLRRRVSILSLRLYDNGMVTLLTTLDTEIPAVLESGAWTTPWVSILPVGRLDRWPKQKLVISRSKNHPDNYRRMLKYLRLGAGAGPKMQYTSRS